MGTVLQMLPMVSAFFLDCSLALWAFYLLRCHCSKLWERYCSPTSTLEEKIPTSTGFISISSDVPAVSFAHIESQPWWTLGCCVDWNCNVCYPELGTHYIVSWVTHSCWTNFYLKETSHEFAVHERFPRWGYFPKFLCDYAESPASSRKIFWRRWLISSGGPYISESTVTVAWVSRVDAIVG